MTLWAGCAGLWRPEKPARVKLRLGRPGEGVLFDGFVVGVKGGFEEENGGDARLASWWVGDFVEEFTEDGDAQVMGSEPPDEEGSGSGTQ